MEGIFLDIICIPELTLGPFLGLFLSHQFCCSVDLFRYTHFVLLMTCEPKVQILILSVKPSSLSIYRDAGPLTNWPLSVSEGAICSAPTIGEKEKGVLPLISNALIITNHLQKHCMRVDGVQ